MIFTEKNRKRYKFKLSEVNKRTCNKKLLRSCACKHVTVSMYASFDSSHLVSGKAYHAQDVHAEEKTKKPKSLRTFLPCVARPTKKRTFFGAVIVVF